jgi:hypothetical protein
VRLVDEEAEGEILQRIGGWHGEGECIGPSGVMHSPFPAQDIQTGSALVPSDGGLDGSLFFRRLADVVSTDDIGIRHDLGQGRLDCGHALAEAIGHGDHAQDDLPGVVAAFKFPPQRLCKALFGEFAMEHR